MTREYDVDFRYSAGGRGVGIALYKYEPFRLFPPGPLSVEQKATMAFTLDNGTLLAATGDPSIRLDSGYQADDWHSVRELLYEDSPDDGTIEDMLNDEHPGLLDVVRDCLKTHRSHNLTLLTGKPIRIPVRGKTRPVTRAGALVRAFLGLSGTDAAGHRVIVHNKAYTGLYGVRYLGTVVYETRSWTNEFQEWYENYLEETRDNEPQIDPLSSYEIAVVPEPLRRER